MTISIVADKSQVVPQARAIVERQDDWTEAQEVLFISLMNYLAGYGYQVGGVQYHFDLFRKMMAVFSFADPGSLPFDQAVVLITTSAEFISAGL